ncbi:MULTISPECIES: CmpA/NrtA family ABC transporter substrate-binding protein [unclassified Methylobacterium]|jgi:two-component system, oxyanion-binding sensor|uniref:CmpA/NrtA family ABC transporter substrate-binding protein n=1 Tax=unclassified Methylobacterium TaxID=2615210 RepID=UPI0013558679|nr:CmpA/NrtA family ABC transporter substrate-binding protein [Methylobacterium sp. 2A]MWV26226.1 ABC transporter substrate-binding protein [Methylobacterium sp. 2A]
MRLQLGYVPLCDAAPLIVAHELGFARAEGLELDLTAEPSWATLRDRLALGHLDGAHMLAPLALASRLGLSGPPSDLIVPMQLSLNGNAITLSRSLWDAMAPESEEAVAVARAFARVAEERRASGQPLTLGTVHPFSCHSYQLRLFAEAGGLDPAAFRTVVVPPQYSVETLARGLVDGFCAGAPWNDVAVAAGHGRIAVLGSALAPDAPEKVLAMSERLDGSILPLVRAVARAGRWCADPENRAELIHRLAYRTYLALDAAIIARTFADASTGQPGAGAGPTFGAAIQEPQPAHARWLLAQMQAAHQIADRISLEAAIPTVYRPDLYRAAVADL